MAENASTEIMRELAAIEQRSRPVATDLPVGVDDKEYTEALLFSLVDRPVVCLMSDVMEILNLPAAVTPVPGARNWVLGIANIRGNLLPLVDLQLFLGGRPIPYGRRNRVLVIEHSEGQVGLSVGEVRGVRQFTEEQRVPPPETEGPITDYLAAAYRLDDGVLPVFSMPLLSESAGFKVAAA